MRHLRSVLPLLLIACGEPLSPVVDLDRLHVDFSTWAMTDESPPAFAASGDHGGIIVRGSIVVGRGGFQLHPALTLQESGVYCLTVTAAASDSPAIDISIHHRYIATIHTLPPGRYRLRVDHTVGNRSQTVLETTVPVQ